MSVIMGFQRGSLSRSIASLAVPNGWPGLTPGGVAFIGCVQSVSPSRGNKLSGEADTGMAIALKVCAPAALQKAAGRFENSLQVGGVVNLTYIVLDEQVYG